MQLFILASTVLTAALPGIVESVLFLLVLLSIVLDFILFCCMLMMVRRCAMGGCQIAVWACH